MGTTTLSAAQLVALRTYIDSVPERAAAPN